MKKYHYSNGDNQFGPLTIEELKDSKITKDTIVWYEGLDNWVKAGEVDELKELFKSIPPPLNTTKQTQPPPISKPTEQTYLTSSKENPNNNKKKLIIGFIVGAVILGVFAIIFYNKNQSSNNNNYDTNSTDTYNSSNNNSYSEPTNTQQNNYTPPPPKQKTEEELRQELYNKEKKKPKDYLSVTYKLKYKVLSGQDQITGTIYNSASMATFKDIVLTVTYSTNTGTELSTEDYVVYEYVYPGSSTSFNIKTYSPSGTKQIGVKVKSATGD